jgi:hypothetical protein
MRIQPSPTPVVHTSPAARLDAPARAFSQLVSRPGAGPGASQPLALKSAMASGAPSGSTSSTPPASSTGATADTGGVQSSLDQSEDQNMEFLQLQSQMNAQSETFTTLSNVMKTENDTIKNTASNMQI